MIRVGIVGSTGYGGCELVPIFINSQRSGN